MATRRGTAFRLAEEVASRVPLLAPHRVTRPVFVVGAPRSGTTLVNRLLARHPELAVYPTEAAAWWHPRMYPADQPPLRIPPQWRDPDRWVANWRANWTWMDEQRLKAVLATFALASEGRTLVNKNPEVAHLLPELLAMFPDARVIHVVRDGRGELTSHVLKSCADAGLEPTDEIYETHARFWTSTVRRVRADARATGLVDRGGLAEVHYEDLCLDVEAELTALAGWLGITDRFDLRGFEEVSGRGNARFDALDDRLRSRLELLLAPGFAAIG